MSHPADHPVFANMPNTQAHLRATHKEPTMPTTNLPRATAIDGAIHRALRDEFGPDFDLSNVLLHEIEDVIVSTLMAAGRGDYEECIDQAQDIATRLDGTRTWPAWV